MAKKVEEELAKVNSLQALHRSQEAEAKCNHIIQFLEDTIKKNPLFALKRMLCVVYFNMNRWEKAEEHLRKIVAEYSKNQSENLTEVYTTIGHIEWYYKKNIPEAIKYLNLALQQAIGITDPNIKTEPHNFLGTIYYEQGDYEKARYHAMKRLAVVKDCKKAKMILLMIDTDSNTEESNSQETEDDNIESDSGAMIDYYLSKSNRCSMKVVIASPRYGGTDYTCEITVDTRDLLPWAKSHASGVWSSNKEAQAATEAFPVWLQEADLLVAEPSYIPHLIYEDLRPWIGNIIRDVPVKIFCFECQCFVDVDSIQKEQKDVSRSAGGWVRGTTIWTCPNGHQLYYDKTEVHLLLR
jgi:tetratricopeptide (TPR) repeat protein